MQNPRSKDSTERTFGIDPAFLSPRPSTSQTLETPRLINDKTGKGKPVIRREKLIVVEHPRFRNLWEAEIKEGNLSIEITTAKKAYKPNNTVEPNQTKAKYDFEIPILKGGIVDNASLAF